MIGSVVGDIGCGNGKYLNANPNCSFIGIDMYYSLSPPSLLSPLSSPSLFSLPPPLFLLLSLFTKRSETLIKICKEKGHHVIISDNLFLPFRSDSMVIITFYNVYTLLLMFPPS